MAFGALKISGSNAATSGVSPTAVSLTSTAVAVGDLVFVAAGQLTSLQMTAASDNLGNTYSSAGTAGDAGSATIAGFYSIVTVAGSITTVTVTGKSTSANDHAVVVCVYEGPFSTADKLLATIADNASPFACPATGVLAQADELVIGYGAGSATTSFGVLSATSPMVLDAQAAFTAAASVRTGIASRVVAATTTSTPTFTATATGTVNGQWGTSTFAKQGAINTNISPPTDDLAFSTFAPTVANVDPNAPFVRSVNKKAYSVNINTVIPAPASIVVGDALVVILTMGLIGGPPTPTAPAGFTLQFVSPTAQDGSNFQTKNYVYTKLATGSEPSTYTFTHTSASSEATIAAVGSAHTAITNWTNNVGTGATATAIGLDTNQNGALVFYVSQNWGDATTPMSPPTGTTPTFTEWMDAPTTSLQYVAAGSMPTRGRTGDKTQTVNSAPGNPFAAMMFEMDKATNVVEFTRTLTANYPHVEGYTMRMRIEPYRLVGMTAGTTALAVSFLFGALTSGNIAAAYIGHAASSGDGYDFDGSQVQLTFAGSGSVAVSGAATKKSDAATFTLDPTKALIISAAFTGTRVDLAAFGGTTSNPQFIQAAKTDFTTSTASKSVSFSAGVAPGSFIVVAGSFDKNTTGVTISNGSGDVVTIVDPLFAHPTALFESFVQAFFAPTAGVTTITATYTGTAPTFGDLFIWEFAGLPNPTFDKVIHATGSGTAADSGSSGTLTVPTEAAIGFFVVSTAMLSAGAGWATVAGDGVVSNTGSLGEHRTVSATTAINATGTLATSGQWTAHLATFKAGD